MGKTSVQSMKSLVEIGSYEKVYIADKKERFRVVFAWLLQPENISIILTSYFIPKKKKINWSYKLINDILKFILQICVRCNEPIKTASVKHDGNVYHSECFTCTMCAQPLAGKPFTKHEGNNVCQDCYRNNFAKRCAACEKLIEGSVKFVAYGEKFYHRDCFTCARCGMALAGEKFRVVEDEKVCIKCSS